MVIELQNKDVFDDTYRNVPMYKILRAIVELRINDKLATSPRLSILLGKSTSYVNRMLQFYWSWNLVSRKNIKVAHMKHRKTEKCVYHWDLNSNGKQKFKYLRAKFGDVIITDTQPKDT